MSTRVLRGTAIPPPQRDNVESTFIAAIAPRWDRRSLCPGKRAVHRASPSSKKTTDVTTQGSEVRAYAREM